jgi:copper homeostasis protein
MCSDPVIGLEDIISAGASRLLTSGQKNKAPEGSELITRLVKLAGKRIIVMPGSGLDESNIAAIARSTGAFEFHLSGRKTADSNMTFRREGIYMGGDPDINEYSGKIADPEKILNIINILKMI